MPREHLRCLLQPALAPRPRRLALLLLAVAWLAGCSGILGIDELPATTDAEPDGDDSGASDADGAARPQPTELAAFELVINGTPVPPPSCSEEPFGFHVLSETTAAIKNTGNVPLAYLAQEDWNAFGAVYVPGTSTGSGVAGVLGPGAQVDITSTYPKTGIVALVGAAEPFTAPDAGAAADQGTTPWPKGVPGSDGATTMYVAEVTVNLACGVPPTKEW